MEKSNMTLTEVAEGYFVYLRDVTKRFPGGIEYERSIYEAYIEPVFGNVPIWAISTKVLETYYVSRLETGFKEISAQQHIAIIARVFTYAKWKGLVDTNPVANMAKPAALRLRAIRKLI